MGISFPNIPANNLVPLFQLEFANSGQPGAQTQQTLLIGNTVTAQPNVPVFVPSVALAVTLFGAGSVLAQMVESYLAADPAAELWCLPFADAGGATAASGNFSISGTATAAGNLSFYIGGRNVVVPVTVGMTASQAATAAVAALNAYVDPNGVALPVASAIDGTHNYQVDLTTNNKGTQGNSIDLRLNYYGAQGGEAIPAGLTVAVTAMSGGATDPVVTGLDPILGNINYDFIAIPWSTTTQLNAFQTLMSNATGRWSYLRQMYGHVWAAKEDADATGATNLAFGLARDDQHMTVFSYEPAPITPWECAAGAMGASAASLRNDPARPLQTLALPNAVMKPPPSSARYTRGTQQSLLSAGMALLRYAADGTISIMRAVTTYQLNQWGVPDPSYRDAETLYTLMAVVRTLKSDVLTKFPRAKLADNGTSFGPGTTFTSGSPDQPIVTPNSIRAEMIASYSGMVTAGLVEDVATFAAGLIVQRNATDATRVDTLFDPILLSGLRTLAILVQFYLQDPA